MADSSGAAGGGAEPEPPNHPKNERSFIGEGDKALEINAILRLLADGSSQGVPVLGRTSSSPLRRVGSRNGAPSPSAAGSRGGDRVKTGDCMEAEYGDGGARGTMLAKGGKEAHWARAARWAAEKCKGSSAASGEAGSSQCSGVTADVGDTTAAHQSGHCPAQRLLKGVPLGIEALIAERSKSQFCKTGRCDPSG